MWKTHIQYHFQKYTQMNLKINYHMKGLKSQEQITVSLLQARKQE